MKMWRCYKVVDAIFRYSQSRMQSRGKLREEKNYRIAVYSLISEKGIKQIQKEKKKLAKKNSKTINTKKKNK